MTNPTQARQRLLGRLAIVTAVCASWWMSSTASAGANLYYNGSMKNYALDVLFWGVGFTEQDRADVREYVVNVANYMNGAYSPAGSEPALHYYGVWGVYPESWIIDTNPVPTGALYGNSGSLSDASFIPEINAARNGQFGSAFDFHNVATGSGFPTSPNRLVIVVTKGTNQVSDNNCENLVHHPCIDTGVHDTTSGVVWAAVQFDSGPNNVVYRGVLAHEMTEAMTDPALDAGWVTNQDCFLGICTSHQEACDQCGYDFSMNWVASSNDNISGVSQMTLDPSYGGLNNISTDTCQTWEPEQYAPIAAALEFGGTASVVYRTPAGHINALRWPSDRGTPSGPYDYGQPSLSPAVTAQGKPSIIYGFSSPGEMVFVRGSDNALWMHNSSGWTSLGGGFYGDPSAVNWNGNANQNVFVLGVDDNIYTYVLANGVPQGWSPIQNNVGRVFSGPPKAFSKSSTTIDVFAVGENGHLEWLPYSLSGGWSVLTDLGTMLGNPHHTPVSITSWASNRLDILATSESAVASRGWNGSWASDYDTRGNELGTTPSGTPAVVSWGPNRLDAFMIDRQNRLTHTSYVDGHWYADANNPMRSDAVGDPVLLSRGSGLLEVFYRTWTGSLSHLVYNASWSNQLNVLPANSIQ